MTLFYSECHTTIFDGGNSIKGVVEQIPYDSYLSIIVKGKVIQGCLGIDI